MIKPGQLFRRLKQSEWDDRNPKERLAAGIIALFILACIGGWVVAMVHEPGPVGAITGAIVVFLSLMWALDNF